MSEHKVTTEVIANLIRDMASEFIKSRSLPGEGVGAYVDKRHSYMGQLERAQKEKQVIGRIELAQNVAAMANEIALKCMDDILRIGIPHYYGKDNDQHT